MREHENCPTCTCGKIEVVWSDRSMYINPKNPDEIVDAISSCVLDHYYDRTANGLPDGLPGYLNTIANWLRRYLDRHAPDWQTKTIRWTNDQIIEFEVLLRDEVFNALQLREN